MSEQTTSKNQRFTDFVSEFQTLTSTPGKATVTDYIAALDRMIDVLERVQESSVYSSAHGLSKDLDRPILFHSYELVLNKCLVGLTTMEYAVKDQMNSSSYSFIVRFPKSASPAYLQQKIAEYLDERIAMVNHYNKHARGIDTPESLAWRDRAHLSTMLDIARQAKLAVMFKSDTGMED